MIHSLAAVDYMASNHSISAIAVLDLARELALLDILDDESLLGLEKDYDNDIESRVPEDALVNLWRLAADNLAHPEVGLLIGSKVNKDAKGVLANWISQCETLDEAFKVFNDNIVLLNASENWAIERQKEYVKLRFSFSSQYEYPIAAIERSMSALVMWAGDLCEGPITIESASFRHTAPEYEDRYHSIFGSNITFSKNENSLLLKASIFDKKIKSANPYLQEIVATRAKKLLPQASAINSNLVTSTRVRELLLTDLVRFHSVESACQEMHLSRTSLYRKLKAEGVTFREILETVQVEKYHQGIERGLVVSDLCDLLGFSDPSTFYKARKRWLKTTTITEE